MVFYNFLNLFAMFLKFSISGRVGIHRNDNFCFLSFAAFPYLFWLRREALMVFYNFLNLFPMFLKVSISGRVGTHRNDNFCGLLFKIKQVGNG